MLHPVLLRQLRRSGLTADTSPNNLEAWGQLLESVSRSYMQADQDRVLMDRSMELSTAEMMQLHASVASHRDDLERQVQQRTEQLQTAKLAAEASNRAKSDFLANMSHEIRTPLNGVIGMIELVANSPLTTKQKQHLELAKRSAWSLTKVIGDILDFSKIEAGKLELCVEDMDLAETIRQTIAQFTIRAQSKGIELVLSIGEKLPARLKGDPDRLRQVLVNLIGNAVKFTASGMVKVCADAIGEVGADGKVTIRFEVTDTGVGLNPEQISRLFQAFSQADSSTTRRFGGTGLGLAIGRQLVGLMGGEIGVTSTPGEGSTFWFTAQFAVSAQSDVVQAAGSQDSGQPIALVCSTTKLRILIADDNDINQMLTQEILLLSGYESDVVSNGHQAIDAAITGRYALILMDCQMPEMDGFEASRQIRQMSPPQGARIPIIALTANAIKGDRERCISAGMDDYLSKPIEPAKLLDMVYKYTGCSAVRSPEAA